MSVCFSFSIIFGCAFFNYKNVSKTDLKAKSAPPQKTKAMSEKFSLPPKLADYIFAKYFTLHLPWVCGLPCTDGSCLNC